LNALRLDDSGAAQHELIHVDCEQSQKPQLKFESIEGFVTPAKEGIYGGARGFPPSQA
jgi:hypothetical protein